LVDNFGKNLRSVGNYTYKTRTIVVIEKLFLKKDYNKKNHHEKCWCNKLLSANIDKKKRQIGQKKI